MDGPRRFTFTNPQSALYDRIAAVRGGRRGSTRRGAHSLYAPREVSQGLPKFTLMVDSLNAEFPGGEHEAVSQLTDGWSKVKKAVTPSYMAHMR